MKFFRLPNNLQTQLERAFEGNIGSKRQLTSLPFSEKYAKLKSLTVWPHLHCLNIFVIFFLLLFHFFLCFSVTWSWFPTRSEIHHIPNKVEWKIFWWLAKFLGFVSIHKHKPACTFELNVMWVSSLYSCISIIIKSCSEVLYSFCT